MATATKKCRVCGGEYEACHTLRRVEGIFRWQDVACCPEHGATYLSRIEASRDKNTAKKMVKVFKPAVENTESESASKSEYVPPVVLDIVPTDE